MCIQVEGDSEREFWRGQQAEATAQGGHWVPHIMSISLSDDGQLSVVEGEISEEKVWELNVSVYTTDRMLSISRKGVLCMS